MGKWDGNAYLFFLYPFLSLSPPCTQTFLPPLRHQSEKPLNRSESRPFPRVTASEDPILKRIGEEDESAVVFVTDNVISTLMCAPRSVYSWDLVVQVRGRVSSSASE